MRVNSACTELPYGMFTIAMHEGFIRRLSFRYNSLKIGIQFHTVMGPVAWRASQWFDIINEFHFRNLIFNEA